jgi:hypothetical protein
MTTRNQADTLPTASSVRSTTANDLPLRSTAVHLLHEDLARAQIRERVREAKRERQVAQLVRARRLSRREQNAGLRARLLRARFDSSNA